MLFWVVGLVVYGSLWVATPYRPGVPLFLAGLAGAFLFQVWCLSRAGRSLLSPTAAVTLMVILRLMFIVQGPTLSEDAYRYLWDGQVAASGISPYLQTPEELEQLQAQYSSLFSRMAHRDRTSIYPPVAQVLFWVNTVVGGALWSWKLILLAAEGWLFWLWLARLRLPLPSVLIWGMHPLVIIEFYSSGHLDLIALVFLVGAMVLADSQKSSGTGLLLALATLVKIFPGFALPLLFQRMEGARRKAVYLVTFILGLLVVWTAYLLWFPSPLEALTQFGRILRTYQDSWIFNSLPFFYFKSWRVPLGRWSALGFALGAVILSRHPVASLRDLALRYYFLIALLLALSHTVHPWYVSWILIVYPIIGLRYRAGFYLSIVASLSYLHYWFQPPGDQGWLLLVEYVPFYILLLQDLRQYHRTS